jgi:hypothetical protein
MLSRGVIIGKIVDELSQLGGQINLRCQVGLTDLNKFCEDFIKEVLNISYQLELENLNENRSNAPGLDLGDKSNSIAVQVTSTATSQKVNKTLEAITSAQLKQYKKFKIFILGEKQSAYSAVDHKLKKKCHNFNPEMDVIDFTDLAKQIVSLTFEELFLLNSVFEKEFPKVIVEIQIPDKDGKFPTSLSDKLEVVPDTMCTKGQRFLSEFPGHQFKDIENAFKDLTKLPRVTRQFLEVLVTRGEVDDINYKLDYRELTRILHVPEREIGEEISILARKRLAFQPEPSDQDWDVKTNLSATLSEIIDFAKNHGTLSRILVALDFTLLDTKKSKA